MRNVATEIHKQYKFPITSFVQAVKEFNNSVVAESQYAIDTFIMDVVGKPIPTQNLREAQVMAGYVVQEAVRLQVAGIPAEPDMVIEQATNRCRVYFESHPWDKPKAVTTEDGEVEEGFVATRTKRAPRGSGQSKKEKAVACFSQHRDKSRKELIEIFVKELGLTPAGASTYVHNCQKGLWK